MNLPCFALFLTLVLWDNFMGTKYIKSRVIHKIHVLYFRNISTLRTSLLNTASVSLGLALLSLCLPSVKNSITNDGWVFWWCHFRLHVEEKEKQTFCVYKPLEEKKISLTKFDGNAPTLPFFTPIHHPSSICHVDDVGGERESMWENNFEDIVWPR